MNPELHRLELDLDARGHGTVKLDGRVLSTKRVEVDADARDMTEVRLTLVNVAVKGAVAADQAKTQGLNAVGPGRPAAVRDEPQA